MKLIALLPLLLVGIGVSTLSSCKKDTVQNVVVPNKTYYRTLEPGNWKYDAESLTYYADIQLSQITPEVRDIDAVIVYISAGQGVYEAIPSVYANESYTYTYQAGLLTLEVSKPGGGTVQPRKSLSLKIVIVQSSN